jgi:hypothetical protein
VPQPINGLRRTGDDLIFNVDDPIKIDQESFDIFHFRQNSSILDNLGILVHFRHSKGIR